MPREKGEKMLRHSYVILAIGALALAIGASGLAAETIILKATDGSQKVKHAPGGTPGVAGDIVAGNVTASGTVHAGGPIKSGNTITINGAPFPGASDVITASTGQLAIGGAPSFALIQVGIGTTSPSAETTLHVRGRQDNFGVLVDSLGVPGSRIGLHAGTARFASLAKNAFFTTGTGWMRFDTATGSYLQEVEPAGHVTFNVAPSAATPAITWKQAMKIRNDGRVDIGGQAVKISNDGRVGIGGAPTVINYTTGPFKPLFTVHGAIRVEDVPVWDGPNEHDLTWGAGFADGVRFDPDRLLISREGSSRRYKEDIGSFEEDFAKILAVEPKVYRMRDGYGPPGLENFGYIAEDLDEAGLKNLVIYDREGRPDGVRYKKVVLYVNEVVKAHHKMIEQLQAEIAALKKVVCSRHPTEAVCDGGRTARAW
jgi:hypothetical protein